MNNDQNMNNFWNIINKLHQEEKPQTHEPMDIRIGIWGGSNSGKTTYLTMLYKELVLSNEWEVTSDSEARKYVFDNIQRITDGNFPFATQITGVIKIFTYILRRQFSNTATGPKIVLNFIDAPGKFYEEIHSSKDVKIIQPSIQSTSEEQEITQNQSNLGIVDYLLSCDGIIFLLDPIRSKEEGNLYWRLLLDLFWEFQERSRQENMTTERLQQYMAFCVTKSDTDDIWSQGKKSDDLAKDVMGKDLFKSLKSNFCIEGRYNFFSVASIGRYQNEDGEWKEAVIYPNIQDNSKTETIETTEKNPSSMKRTYGKHKGKSQNSQTTDVSSEEPTISSNSSSEDDDEWAEFTETSNTPDIAPRYIPTINTKVEIQPLNVIAPIEWLINSIQKEPLSRLEPK